MLKSFTIRSQSRGQETEPGLSACGIINPQGEKWVLYTGKKQSQIWIVGNGKRHIWDPWIGPLK